MGASNTIKAIGTMLRIKVPLMFDRFIFICSDISTSNIVLCGARILQAN